MRRFACVLFLFCYALANSSCNEKEVEKAFGEFEYLTELCVTSERYGVEIQDGESFVSMGGNEYYGSVVLGNVEKENKNKC